MARSVVEEFVGADFNDERLTKRLYKIAELFGDQPNKSFPAAAVGGRADLEGAYRLFNNPKVCPDKILATHRQKTLERIQASSSKLIVIKQDTSKCDLTRPHQQVSGAGFLVGKLKRGIFLHPLLVSTLERVPLGNIGQQNYVRKEISTLPQKKSRSNDTPNRLNKRKAVVGFRDYTRFGRQPRHVRKRHVFSCRIAKLTSPNYFAKIAPCPIAANST